MNMIFAFGVNLMGWLGMALAVTSYWAVSNGKLSGTGKPYQYLNVSSAVLLAFACAIHGAWFAVVLNVIWIGIGLQALGRPKATQTPLQAAQEKLVGDIRVVQNLFAGRGHRPRSAAEDADEEAAATAIIAASFINL